MRIVFIGSGDFAVPTLRALVDARHDIPCVVTQPDRPAGRGRSMAPTPVKSAATALGLSVVEAADVNDPALVTRVSQLRACVGVVVAFGQKIKSAFRDALAGGCINLHASLLPRHRGAAPFQWSIIRGDRVTGVTVFKLVDPMDAGPILATAETDIGQTETAAELHDRLAVMGPAVVLEALALFAGDVPGGRLQDERLATTAPKLKKTDGQIKFDEPAIQIARRINGLWSWPGATCCFESRRGNKPETVILARAQAENGDQSIVETACGTVEQGLRVVTSDGLLSILEVKPQSGRCMSWLDFVNGRNVGPGDRFVPIMSSPFPGNATSTN